MSTEIFPKYPDSMEAYTVEHIEQPKQECRGDNCSVVLPAIIATWSYTAKNEQIRLKKRKPGGYLMLSDKRLCKECFADAFSKLGDLPE